MTTEAPPHVCYFMFPTPEDAPPGPSITGTCECEKESEGLKYYVTPSWGESFNHVYAKSE
jgi:hypothetical protein